MQIISAIFGIFKLSYFGKLAEMPHKCCALNCRTGYNNQEPAAASGISLFRFPKDPDLVAEWKKRITRQNWKPTESSRVCSLHFKEEDIVREKHDSNKRRTKLGPEELSAKPRLRIGAIPTIFENLPSYKNLPAPEERSSAPRVSAESRRRADEIREEEHIDQFFAEDVIQSPDEVLEKAQKEVLPEGFILSKKKKSCSFFYMAESESGQDVPQLLASLTVMEDLTFSASALGKLIRPSRFQHLLRQRGRFGHFSEVANVLSALKNLAGEPEKTDWLKLAGDCLSQFLDLNEDLSDELRGRIQFLKDQISLAPRKPIGRRYSPEMIITSFLVHAASAQAYRQLKEQNLLVLPSERTLRNVTKTIGTSSADTDEYLKLRIEKLAEHERTVTLVVDEIYVAKRVEYSAPQGQLIGLTEDHTQAGTVLCFMVCSVLGKYRDIVAMYPVGRLTVEKLRKAFMEVLERVTGLGFQVLASVMDNHVVNRNFYIQLCRGQLNTNIPNPFGRESIFLLFDTVHNFKNIYNNFQKRRDFVFPPITGTRITRAHFGDIQDLFAQENEKPLKLAHTLSEKVVSPNAVRKASVQIANSLFHESTRDALFWFTENEGMPWGDTGQFIDHVLCFWKIVNVRSPSTGHRKRDEDRKPICSTSDEKLDFLKEFADWLERWKEQSPSQCGLSPATFLANIHTCRTLIELSRHCIDVLGFDYVLLGKFQSDALEGRFGWYRQLSGGNYYISLRQVLENERKIKAVSLLRMSKFSLAELGRLEDMETPRLVEEKASELQQVVQTKLDSDLSTMDSSDANAVGYVAGALVRTELNQRKCQGCAELLKDSRGEKLPEIPLSTLGEDGEIQPVSTNILNFVEQINRGGLLAPSTLALSIGLKCWAVFNCIDKSKELQNEILSSTNQQLLFVAIVEGLLKEDADFEEISVPKLECPNGHNFARSLIRRFFNCIAKNWVKRLSGDGTGGQSMKIAKLTSHW